MAASKRNATSFTPETAPRTGRRPGQRNRRTLFREYVATAAQAKGVDPLAFLLGLIADEEVPLEAKQMAARDVLPYTHKRMPQAIEMDANIKLKSDFASAVAAVAAAPKDPQGGGE